jgi:sec-independent protein translocase protein TatC
VKEMSFTEHLEELRYRIIRILIIIAVSFFICYGFGEFIQEILLSPLRSAVGANGKIVYLGLLDKVLAQFQVAFWSSIILSSPLWFYQLWSFLKPALYEHEIKVIRPFIVASFCLFLTGIAFGYFLVFPFTFETIMGFGVEQVEASLSLKDYLILASKVLVFLGVLFQLPNLMVILGLMELVTKYSLASHRRYVYLAFGVVSAILTPPDVITMMALWLPLAVLFELGIIAVGLIVHPHLKKKYAN